MRVRNKNPALVRMARTAMAAIAAVRARRQPMDRATARTMV
jgi:hypothetical protein